MNIVLITSEPLKDFPPIITLLKTLSGLGHAVTVITPFKDNYFPELKLTNCNNVFVNEAQNEKLTRYYSNKIKASLSFHTNNLIRSRSLRKIPKAFSGLIKSADIVWVLHENTFRLSGRSLVRKLGDYLFTMYELHIRNQKENSIYEHSTKSAVLTIVPEYTRAHITKAYYGLNYLPSVIPNRPDEHPRTRFMQISNNDIANKIHVLHQSKKKLLMYMGILSAERPLEPIIEALRSNDEYVLVVLGGRTPYLDSLEKKYSGEFVYLGEVKPPQHLEIASHADIAYICYVSNNGSINAVFCAPNKVFEFAGFGIPMLCNDNPGLKYTVEYNNMGVCVPSLTPDNIHRALIEINRTKESMSAAAQQYYDNESVEQAVSDVLDRYCAFKKEKQGI